MCGCGGSRTTRGFNQNMVRMQQIQRRNAIQKQKLLQMQQNATQQNVQEVFNIPPRRVMTYRMAALMQMRKRQQQMRRR